VEKIGNRRTDGRTDGRTDRGTISIEHIFLKTCSNKYPFLYPEKIKNKTNTDNHKLFL
jgi:hypothetical protein